MGLDVSRLVVSRNAHLIMPYHLELEKVTERFLGKNALGTTKRGIGPAYGDKAARIGLRIQDLFDEKILREKLDVVLREKNQILTKVYNRLPLDADRIVEEYIELPRSWAARRRHRGAAASGLARRQARDARRRAGHDARPRPRHVSVRHVVEARHRLRGGVGRLRSAQVERVIGIMKAYVTRVGAGPFPTEALDAEGEQMGERGKEFGTITGRKRRCGWFDAVLALRGSSERPHRALPHEARRPFGLRDVKVCAATAPTGVWDDVPPNQTLFHKAEPVWEELPGWIAELGEARTFEDLPKEAQAYVAPSRSWSASRCRWWRRTRARAELPVG